MSVTGSPKPDRVVEVFPDQETGNLKIQVKLRVAGEGEKTYTIEPLAVALEGEKTNFRNMSAERLGKVASVVADLYADKIEKLVTGKAGNHSFGDHKISSKVQEDRATDTKFEKMNPSQLTQQKADAAMTRLLKVIKDHKAQHPPLELSIASIGPSCQTPGSTQTRQASPPPPKTPLAPKQTPLTPPRTVVLPNFGRKGTTAIPPPSLGSPIEPEGLLRPATAADTSSTRTHREAENCWNQELSEPDDLVEGQPKSPASLKKDQLIRDSSPEQQQSIAQARAPQPLRVGAQSSLLGTLPPSLRATGEDDDDLHENTRSAILHSLSVAPTRTLQTDDDDFWDGESRSPLDIPSETAAQEIRERPLSSLQAPAKAPTLQPPVDLDASSRPTLDVLDSFNAGQPSPPPPPSPATSSLSLTRTEEGLRQIALEQKGIAAFKSELMRLLPELNEETAQIYLYAYMAGKQASAAKYKNLTGRELDADDDTKLDSDQMSEVNNAGINAMRSQITQSGRNPSEFITDEKLTACQTAYQEYENVLNTIELGKATTFL